MKQTRDDEGLNFAELAVKCVTGLDAKEVGKVQPASYIVPQKQSVYAKNRSGMLRFFAWLGHGKQMIHNILCRYKNLPAFFSFSSFESRCLPGIFMLYLL